MRRGRPSDEGSLDDYKAKYFLFSEEQRMNPMQKAKATFTVGVPLDQFRDDKVEELLFVQKL